VNTWKIDLGGCGHTYSGVRSHLGSFLGVAIEKVVSR